MVFKRHVEIGRVALINLGPHTDKLAVIVDVLDQTRCLVDSPDGSIPRHVSPFRRLALTDITVPLRGHGARTGTVRKACEKEGVVGKWEKTAWAGKIEKRKKRAAMGDFDRFKCMIAKKKKSAMINKEFKKLKKAM